MLAQVLRRASPVILAGTLGLQLAHADIYTWIDASGSVNISNLAPPEGVHVTNVVHQSAPKTTARDDIARDAVRQAEVQTLAARVRQLEEEAELARRQAPPQVAQVEYRVIQVPPSIDMAPPPVQYIVNMAPQASSGCGAWGDCGLWWGPGIYPAGVVVLRAPHFRRSHLVHGGRHVPGHHQPMHASGGFRRH